MIYQVTEQFARELDERDELRRLAARFYRQPGSIYLDGNSLGLMSRDAEEALLDAVSAWREKAINGWLEGENPWFYLGEELGQLQAGLMGTATEEIVVTGSTTVNLHSLVSTFYDPAGKRTKILADELNFPSDIYALKSQIALKGLDPAEHLVLVTSQDGRTLDEDDIIAAMSDEIALIMLPSILYRSGQLLDMSRLTAAAHERGIIIGFDCCHSAGVIPHQLSAWGVDFAFWCTYKYLNSGPGGVASLYVNQRHFGRTPGLAGWWGYRKDRQFDMSLRFESAAAAGGWQIGTIPVLAAAPLLGSLQIFQEAGIDAIRKKSLELTSYLIYLIDELLTGAPYNCRVGTPRQPGRRGGHVSLEHDDAVRLAAALRRRGVIPDFRPPNVIRLAPVALYNSFHDVWQSVTHIKEIIEADETEQFSKERDVVS